MEQICEALEYIHRQDPPIIHRDIKPSNIRIDLDGNAILVDFGIAKSYEPNIQTVRGAQAVTPGFSPPEQYGHGITDARSDIYALGATLYNLLTGNQPPESILRLSYDSLQLEIPVSDKALEQVIRKAMALRPELRYQTATEFKADIHLRRLEISAPVVDTRPPQHSESPLLLDFSDNIKPLEIPLQYGIQEALEYVFKKDNSRNSIVDAVRNSVLNPSPISGHVIVLYGDRGVGTTKILERIWDDLKDHATQVGIPIDLRGQSKPIEMMDEIRRCVERNDSKSIQKLMGINRKSGNQEMNFKLGLPVVINFGVPPFSATIGSSPLEIQYSAKKSEQGNDKATKVPKTRQAISQKYLSVLRDMVDVLVRSKIPVTLLFDKVDDEKWVKALWTIFRTAGVTTVVVVERCSFEAWGWNGFHDFRLKIYVPQIWDIAEKTIKYMVGNNTPEKQSFSQYSDFIDYVSLKARGSPLYLINALYSPEQFYYPENLSPSLGNKLKGWFWERHPKGPHLCISEKDAHRVKIFGSLHRHAIKVFRLPDITEPRARDTKRKAIYELLDWFGEQICAQKTFFCLGDFADRLQQQGFPKIRSEAERIEKAILRELEYAKIVNITSKGFSILRDAFKNE